MAERGKKIGGQPGNTNSAKGRPWIGAINRALARYENSGKGDALNKLADRIIEAAVEDLDWNAVHELTNRLDGKARQQVEVTGEDGDAIQIELVNSAAASARKKLARLLAAAIDTEAD